jgi:hypothetical protein
VAGKSFENVNANATNSPQMAERVPLIADMKYIGLIWTDLLVDEIHRVKRKRKQATDLDETWNSLPDIWEWW